MAGTLIIGAPGILFLALAGYLLALAAGGFRSPHSFRIGRDARLRLVVLVPAHNEEALVGRCIESLLDQTYPRELCRVIVIADNCTDATTNIATASGAHVMVRTDPDAHGKGRALRWALDRLVNDRGIDAFIVVDADSIADRDLVSQLAAYFEAGHDVVQGEYLVLAEDASLRTRLGELAFLLFHRVRLSGRAALGMPANLVGNGMLFGRDTLRDNPWNAFTSVEDLEYTLNLREAGIRPAFAPGARVRGPMAPGYRAGAGQRVRWEGGRLFLARTRIPGLLKNAALRRDPSLLDSAVDLAVPPLAAFVLIEAAGLVVAAAAVAFRLASAWAVLPWLLGMGALAAFVVVGLWAARAPASMYLALLEIPRFLLWKLAAYFRIATGFDPNRWERTRRSNGEAPPGHIDLAGVRIDPLDMDGALDRIRQAIGSPGLLQVTTINLDFLVRAQTHPELRRAFQRSGLNLPDGAPVVWLGRLLGKRVPARVAGADLVPRLAAEAAASGARIFLLGGESGVAGVAAARLQADHPGLRIAGWLEPPRAHLDDMDHQAMLEAIRDAGADILLVALGHPKQDLWIHRNRDRLPVSVAIGVGCVFDLLAGRQVRAPSWMQKIGLEWLHRLREEPGRLIGRYTADLGWLPVLTAKVLYQRILTRPAGPA